MPSPEQPSLPNTEYRIGWICALPLELTAARAMLDEEHNSPQEQDPSDHNNYCLGRIHEHNVAITCLPDIGTTSATAVAKQMLQTFKEMRFGLMVGIGGGIPNAGNDIRLGDVVVSKPTGTYGGVVQYDLGKAEKGGCFRRTGYLDRPPQVLLAALCRLQSDHEMKGSEIQTYIKQTAIKCPNLKDKYIYPGPEKDLLFREDYDHPNGNRTCEQCDNSQLINRRPRGSSMPTIHYGSIASGNAVIKDASTRSRIGHDLDALCVEMEAAGLMNYFKCLVIRGVCDYADSHKNVEWQRYAAMTAAAYAKELLLVIPAQKVLSEKPIIHVAGQ